MYESRRAKLTGLLYMTPLLLFVALFTVYPFFRMIGVSMTSWTLITPPVYVGLQNFVHAFGDSQFWNALGYTLIYTAVLTPLLIVGGYLLALLVVPNSPLRSFTRTVIFLPVVIGLGTSSLLWYWLFSTRNGFVNKFLMDIGIIGDPIQWLGVDASTSTWAIIISVSWKIIGFGMLLFVGAIRAVPTETLEAAEIDGARYWQRVTRVILPLTMRTVLLMTLISCIGSLLAFDQFYIMTAGQPNNLTTTSVFFVYLNSFQYLKLGYGATLSLLLAAVVLTTTIVQMILTRRSHS